MSIRLTDITNLRVEGHSDHKAAIAFETTDKRFHIWINYRESDGWRMESGLHSNLIGGGYKDHRELDINAASHAKLRAFIAEQVGDLTMIATEAVAEMVRVREQADRDQRKQLAANIRQSLGESNLRIGVVEMLTVLSDADLIQLRGAIYGTKFPDQTFPIGIIGIALTKKAA